MSDSLTISFRCSCFNKLLKGFWFSLEGFKFIQVFKVFIWFIFLVQAGFLRLVQVDIDSVGMGDICLCHQALKSKALPSHAFTMPKLWKIWSMTPQNDSILCSFLVFWAEVEFFFSSNHLMTGSASIFPYATK